MHNFWLKFRDCVLDGFFGIQRNTALNAGESGHIGTLEIVKEIAESVRALKQAAIIQKHGVDYPKLKASAEYRKYPERISPALKHIDLASLTSQNEKLAFWINLYNLLTIDAVLQVDVRKRVTEGWFGMIRFFRQAAYLVDGMRAILEEKRASWRCCLSSCPSMTHGGN